MSSGRFPTPGRSGHPHPAVHHRGIAAGVHAEVVGRVAQVADQAGRVLASRAARARFEARPRPASKNPPTKAGTPAAAQAAWATRVARTPPEAGGLQAGHGARPVAQRVEHPAGRGERLVEADRHREHAGQLGRAPPGRPAGGAARRRARRSRPGGSGRRRRPRRRGTTRWRRPGARGRGGPPGRPRTGSSSQPGSIFSRTRAAPAGDRAVDLRRAARRGRDRAGSPPRRRPACVSNPGPVPSACGQGAAAGPQLGVGDRHLEGGRQHAGRPASSRRAGPPPPRSAGARPAAALASRQPGHARARAAPSRPRPAAGRPPCPRPRAAHSPQPSASSATTRTKSSGRIRCTPAAVPMSLPEGDVDPDQLHADRASRRHRALPPLHRRSQLVRSGVPARMAEWQTRRPQKPLSERACGFESRSGHRGRRSPGRTVGPCPAGPTVPGRRGRGAGSDNTFSHNGIRTPGRAADRPGGPRSGHQSRTCGRGRQSDCRLRADSSPHPPFPARATDFLTTPS